MRPIATFTTAIATVVVIETTRPVFPDAGVYAVRACWRGAPVELAVEGIQHQGAALRTARTLAGGGEGIAEALADPAPAASGRGNRGKCRGSAQDRSGSFGDPIEGQQIAMP